MPAPDLKPMHWYVVSTPDDRQHAVVLLRVNSVVVEVWCFHLGRHDRIPADLRGPIAGPGPQPPAPKDAADLERMCVAFARQERDGTERDDIILQRDALARSHRSIRLALQEVTGRDLRKATASELAGVIRSLGPCAGSVIDGDEMRRRRLVREQREAEAAIRAGYSRALEQALADLKAAARERDAAVAELERITDPDGHPLGPGADS